MWFESIVSRGTMPVLEQVMAFTEERQKVLANNISNIDTVDYQMQDLDVETFSANLADAIEKRASRGAGARLEISESRDISWDDRGRLQARPITVEPGSNILFHDKNNRSIEKQMAEMAKNGLTHNVASELLRGKYSGLEKAIRGTL